MFSFATSFNQDISGWNVSNGQDFVSATESHVISYHLQDFLFFNNCTNLFDLIISHHQHHHYQFHQFFDHQCFLYLCC